MYQNWEPTAARLGEMDKQTGRERQAKRKGDRVRDGGR